jgi:hypothetical protein
MCITIATMIVGAAISAASSIYGAAASSAAAQTESNFKNYQLEMQNRQLKDEQDMVRLKAQQTENERMEQSRRLRAVNEASIAASGVGENLSYLQGVEDYNDRTARQDIATLRLNSADQVSRIADQIQVNKVEGQFATAKSKMTSQAAWTTGVLNAGASLVNGYNSYKGYSVPGSARAH